jgi:hypothetical protein
LNSVLEAIASDAQDADSPRLITVDELRAAGALEVPVAWRKSLGQDRDFFADDFKDAGPRPNEACGTEVNTDEKASSDDAALPHNASA